MNAPLLFPPKANTLLTVNAGSAVAPTQQYSFSTGQLTGEIDNAGQKTASSRGGSLLV